MWFPVKKVVLAVSSLLFCVLSCEFPFIERGDYCFYLTEPRIFSDGCYTKVDELFDVSLYKEMGTFVWLPVGRRYNFGPMVFMNPTVDYAKRVESVISDDYNNYDYVNENCLVIANGTLRASDCFEKYPHLCVNDFRNDTTYKFQNGFRDCAYPDLSFKNCFCKLTNSEDANLEGDEDNEQCELLSNVAPELGTGLGVTGKDVCYLDYISNATCIVETQKIPQSSLILKFDRVQNAMYLTVYPFEGIYSFDDPPIYCFTDATEEIESTVKLHFFNATISDKNGSRHIYNLVLNDHMGSYWCEAFQLSDFTLIRSLKLRLLYPEDFEHSMVLTYENENESVVCMKNPLEMLTKRVIVVLRRIFHDQWTRLMEILDASKDYCRINFIVHLTSKEDNSYFNQTEIEETYSIHDVYGTIRFQSIANAEYCEEENDGTLNWPRTKIGDATTSVETCLDENGIPVRRFCGGNFTYGSRWLETNYTCFDFASTSPLSTQIEDYCLHLTEPNTFENGCERKALELFNSTFYQQMKTPVWLPVGRRFTFGSMVFTNPVFEHGQPIEQVTGFNIHYYPRKDCMVTENQKLYYVDCSEKHPHLCAYYKDGMCDYPYNYGDDCADPALSFEDCFCKLMNVDNSERKCELNLDLTVDKNITRLETRPNIADDNVCYSNSESGITCKVKKEDIPKAELVLKFDVKKKELYLTVYSFEGIYNFKEQPTSCFTDATERFEGKVNMSFVMATVSATSGSRHIYQLELEDYIGNYWCEAFQLPSLNVIKSNKVLAFKEEGSEFAIMLTYKEIDTTDTMCVNYPLDTLTYELLKVLTDIFRDRVKKTRLMEIVDAAEDTCRINLIVHITKDKNDDGYFNQTKIEETYSTQDVKGQIRFQYTANALYCEEENDGTLNWPRTKLGDTTTSMEICVDENGIPVRRLCGGNFTYGARWLKTNYSCSNYTIPPQTQQLYNITLQDMDANLANDAVNISSEAASFIALDIKYCAEILEKMFALRKNSSVIYINDIIEIINNLMESDTETLKQSQNYFNATDDVLHISESLYDDTELLENVTLLQIQKTNYLVQISKPFYNNVFGIALYGNSSSNFANIQTVTLTSSNTLPEFKEDFILAMRLQNDSFYTSTDNLTIITTIYSQDKLFVDSKEVDSKVVSVVVPEFGAFLRKPVTVWFRSNASSNGSCSFWDYGDRFQKKKGQWSDFGGTFVRSFPNESVVECEYSHLTPFALLVLAKQSPDPDYNGTHGNIFHPHYPYLDPITLTGSALSVFGVTVIFISALLFKTWRSEISTKILLSLSFVTLSEVILTQFADLNNATHADICFAIGILLHYTVCSKFCWMLVFAFLQYSRLVQVLKPRTNHLLSKANVIGWLLPLLPVLTLLFLSWESYSPGNFMFCYPKGSALYFGVFMPIGLIIVINVMVFLCILCNIAKCGTQLQIKWAVLLFFALGLPWLFGIFAELFYGTTISYICVYMFCFTAPIQGFILFVFQVLLTDRVRLHWKLVLCYKLKHIFSKTT